MLEGRTKPPRSPVPAFGIVHGSILVGIIVCTVWSRSLYCCCVVVLPRGWVVVLFVVFPSAVLLEAVLKVLLVVLLVATVSLGLLFAFGGGW